MWVSAHKRICEGHRLGKINYRNLESEQLRSFFSAASYSSRNTIPPSSTLLSQEVCTRTLGIFLIATYFLVVSVDLGFSIKPISQNNKLTA